VASQALQARQNGTEQCAQSMGDSFAEDNGDKCGSTLQKALRSRVGRIALGLVIAIALVGGTAGAAWHFDQHDAQMQEKYGKGYYEASDGSVLSGDGTYIILPDGTKVATPNPPNGRVDHHMSPGF